MDTMVNLLQIVGCQGSLDKPNATYWRNHTVESVCVNTMQSLASGECIWIDEHQKRNWRMDISLRGASPELQQRKHTHGAHTE